jgi:hypothetical protein
LKWKPDRLHFFCLAALAALAWPSLSHAIVDQSVVINEVCMFPAPGQDKFVEILNRGPNVVSTLNWWICDHPITYYARALQVPQTGGPAAAPPIMLGPGDFLVVRFHPQFPPPSGSYSSGLNSGGTTTHILQINIPAPAIPSFLQANAGNFSIWDQSPPSNPDDPSFDVPQAIRDFVAWGVSGTYSGLKRGCIAADPVALLWPPPLSGDCQVPAPPPVFPAVSIAGLVAGSGVSINYNGLSANDPTDYFLAPATEGETNIMPGDLDADLDIDMDDYQLFVACLGQPATAPPCSRADFDASLTVECADWPQFANYWGIYSTLPVPAIPASCAPCTPGDVNNDGLVNGEDIGAMVRVLMGEDTDPVHLCAADTDVDNDRDCEDLVEFVRLTLEAPKGCLIGDIDGDGRVNGDDIQLFINEILSPRPCTAEVLCRMDTNLDLLISEEDVPLFVDLLMSQNP